jgi:uncharacterized protein (DUF305 family)
VADAGTGRFENVGLYTIARSQTSTLVPDASPSWLLMVPSRQPRNSQEPRTERKGILREEGCGPVQRGAAGKIPINIEVLVLKALRHWIAAILLIAGAAMAACRTGHGPQIIQPGAPGQPSQVIAADKAVDLSKVQYTAADVRFMQGMIGHHAQALEMAALLPSRTSREDMRLLALRIEVSQADEIKMMQHWLEVRGQKVPDLHAHHAHGATLMPGMLTAEEMSRLAEAKGGAFDQLFLELMIKHHEGALTMVKELFSTPGAGQESDMFAFASDVDADQRMEIERMGAMIVKSKELQ